MDGGDEIAQVRGGGHVTEEPANEDGSRRRAGFLGFVAHEIRNPLSTALWSAELLARMSAAERGSARGEKLSGMCLRALARVRQLVEDHFLCERLDAHGIPLRIETIGVNEAIDAVAAKRPPDAGPMAVEGSADVAVQADRILLERAIDALLAIAGRDGAPVHVAVAGADETATLAVTGKPPDSPEIEDPTKGSPSDPKGRALALPVVRRIAAALGGTLAAADGGWVLSLPRASARGERPAPAAHP